MHARREPRCFVASIAATRDDHCIAAPERSAQLANFKDLASHRSDPTSRTAAGRRGSYVVTVGTSTAQQVLTVRVAPATASDVDLLNWMAEAKCTAQA